MSSGHRLQDSHECFLDDILLVARLQTVLVKLYFESWSEIRVEVSAGFWVTFLQVPQILKAEGNRATLGLLERNLLPCS